MLHQTLELKAGVLNSVMNPDKVKLALSMSRSYTGKAEVWLHSLFNSALEGGEW